MTEETERNQADPNPEACSGYPSYVDLRDMPEEVQRALEDKMRRAGWNAGRLPPLARAAVHPDHWSGEFLDTVGGVLCARGVVHGDATGTFDRIASLWSVELGVTVTPAQVARMMILFKVARASRGTPNPDDMIDAAGYAALAWLLQKQDDPAPEDGEP